MRKFYRGQESKSRILKFCASNSMDNESVDVLINLTENLEREL